MPQQYAPFYCPDNISTSFGRTRRTYDNIPVPRYLQLPRTPSQQRASFQSPSRAPVSLASEIQRHAAIRRHEENRANFSAQALSSNGCVALCAITLCLGATIITPALVLGIFFGPPALWIGVALSALCVAGIVFCCVMHCVRKRSQAPVTVDVRRPEANPGSYQRASDSQDSSQPASTRSLTSSERSDLPPSYAAATTATDRPTERTGLLAPRSVVLEQFPPEYQDVPQPAVSNPADPPPAYDEETFPV